MAWQIELHEVAELELWEAVDFYDSQRGDLGKAFARELDSIMKAIRNNPMQFPKAHHEKRKALMRRFPFVVLFEAKGSTVFVLAIFHTSRNPKIWQAR